MIQRLLAPPGSRRQLRGQLLALLLLLLLPAVLLFRAAWEQVGWEGLHQQQQLARELVAAINRSVEGLRLEETALSFEAYRFALTPAGAEPTVLQRSPLASFPARGGPAGLLGRFQLAADGELTTPLVPEGEPARYGLSADDYARRVARQEAVLEVLDGAPVATPPVEEASNRVDGAARAGRVAVEEADTLEADGPALDVAATPPASAAARRAPALAEPGAALPEAPASSNRRGVGLFDRLTRQVASEAAPAGEMSSGERAADAEPEVRGKRRTPAVAAASDREQSWAAVGGLEANLSRERLRGIDAAVEALYALLLDNGYFLLFRREYRDGERYLQGAVLARDPFLHWLVVQPFRASSLSRVAELQVRWDDQSLAAYGAEGYATGSGPRALSGELVHGERLAAPLGAMRLAFIARDVPPGPGASVILWTGAALLLLTLGAFQLLYRTGLRQLALARQQQEFVAAVSHELRTPLTSIRLYSEMLQAGLGDETRRRDYYRFIQGESERLSRLVANVLELSRMDRTGLALELVEEDLPELVDVCEGRLRQLAEAGGASLAVDRGPKLSGVTVTVDRDALLQVLINLVDNAIKFAGREDAARIELAVEVQGKEVVFRVRDFGPGLPPGDPARLFERFERGRAVDGAVPGTGIGLALVKGLTEAMGGRVSACRGDPRDSGEPGSSGAVFSVFLAARGREPGG